VVIGATPGIGAAVVRHSLSRVQAWASAPVTGTRCGYATTSYVSGTARPVDMAASENVEPFMETVVQRLAVQSYWSTTRAPRPLETSSDDRY
jgi:hypothetical protein